MSERRVDYRRPATWYTRYILQYSQFPVPNIPIPNFYFCANAPE